MAKNNGKTESSDERLQFEKLISGLSAGLINVPANEIDEVIKENLKQLAEFFEADRAVISQYVPEVKGWQRTHYWFSDLFDPKRVLAADGEVLPHLFPCLTEDLIKRGAVVFEHAGQIPPEWKEERQAVETVGVKSGAMVRLSVGGSFLGAIGVDNVHTECRWPEDMIQRLRFIGEIFANALNRKQTQEALDERMRFEMLLTTLMAELSNIPANEIDKIIEEGLRMLGEFFDADRATISQVLEEGERLWPSHIWLSDQYDLDTHLKALDSPYTASNLMVHLNQTGFFVFNTPDDIPESWSDERLHTAGLGFKAGAVVVLRVRDEIQGAITLASIRSERQWSEDLIRRLRFFGEIFARALLCKKSEESLNNAFSELERLKSRLADDDTLLHEDIAKEKLQGKLVGQSDALKDVLDQAEQVAGTDSTVLLRGETGTGKELIACAIHESSLRKDRPMVKVNCAAMPSTLVESELFGREKGAYTGALTKQIGRFEAAHQGTLFLDEIGELPPEVQVKLLRVLQEGEFERLGSPESRKVDVRIIAATNKNLEESVKDGSFREDLYYRVNVFPLAIPPLRQRREDIPSLVWSFVKEFGKKMGKTIKTIARKDMEALQGYSWPGNIRELRNVIERSMILCKGDTLPIEIPRTLFSKRTEPMSLEELARKHIIEILEMTEGRVRGEGGAAEILGLKPTTLEARMQKLGIDRKK